MKRNPKLNRVHINDLPDDIVVKILTPLPIQDAIRTSILSKRWRNSWKKIPNLIFDYKFCRQQSRMISYHLIKAIYQVLLLHHGPLLTFVLSLLDSGSDSEIDKFILTALQKGVKDLTVSTWKCENYIFPRTIFAYGQQLVKLYISYSVFQPPSDYKGFTKLVTLTLVEVSIEGGRLSRLISSCPLLEYLCCISSTICDHLHIEAPNLEVFCFKGICEFVNFKNTPKLGSVVLYSDVNIKKQHLEEVEARGGCRLRGRLPVVEQLEVEHFYGKNLIANRAPASLLNDLCHLKSLSTYGIVSALCILRNAKNLEKLEVYVENKNYETDSIVKEVEGFSDLTFDRLRKVVLGRFTGFESEMEFIKLILAKSPVLERVVLRRALFSFNLPRFQRASALVEVVFEC